MVRQLAQAAEAVAVDWVLTQDVTAEDLAIDLAGLVSPYASTAALLAADWYDNLEDSGYSAVLDDDMAQEKLDNAALWIMSGTQLPESRMRVAANKMVFDAARRTVFVNAHIEGVALAREEEAGCCNDCVARATTVAKARNSTAVVEQDFHPGCMSLYFPVRGDLYTPPDYAREWHSRIKSAKLAGAGSAEEIA